MAEEERQVSIHRLAKPSLLASSRRRVDAPRPTPEHPMLLSASELSSFLRCRVQHYWRYQVRLVHPHKNLAQSIGTLGHIMLDDWYQLPVSKRDEKGMQRVTVDAVKKARDVDPSQMALEDKDRELVTAMCIGYAKWANDPLRENSDVEIGLADCAPEEWFDLPLTKDGSIRVRGKLDNRFFPLKYKKTVAILESKFKGQIRFDPIENRLQLTVYLWALRQKFPKMRRFQAYPQILRKQMPGPRVKADLFHRDMVERSDDEIDQWAVDARHIAQDILDGAVYPSPMDSCSWMCDFTVPCQLRGDKADLRHVLRTNFIRREESK